MKSDFDNSEAKTFIESLQIRNYYIFQLYFPTSNYYICHASVSESNFWRILQESFCFNLDSVRVYRYLGRGSGPYFLDSIRESEYENKSENERANFAVVISVRSTYPCPKVEILVKIRLIKKNEELKKKSNWFKRGFFKDIGKRGEMDSGFLCYWTILGDSSLRFAEFGKKGPWYVYDPFSVYLFNSSSLT